MNVLIIGKAKTGTTVISKTIQNSIEGETAYHLEPKKIDYFQLRSFQPNVSHVVKIIFEHWNATPRFRNGLIFNESNLKFDRIVSIVRDPRDEMISRMFYVIKPIKDTGKLTETDLKAWLKLVIQKENDPASIGFFAMAEEFDRIFKTGFGHGFKTYSKRAKEYNDFLQGMKNLARNHVLKYEDFIMGHTEQLESSLHLKLTNNRDVGLLERTKRTSDFNNWKEFFIPEDVKIFKEMFGTTLEDCGYSDFELSPIERLNPEYYSDYIVRISELDIDLTALRS